MGVKLGLSPYGKDIWQMFKIRVLRKIFGPKRDEVTGDWRKLHSEELRDLYFSIKVIRVIKSRMVRWAEHVGGVHTGLWWGNLRGRDRLEDIGGRWEDNIKMFLISNFRRVLNVVCFLLGDSPASEIYMPTFRNTVPSS